MVNVPNGERRRMYEEGCLILNDTQLNTVTTVILLTVTLKGMSTISKMVTIAVHIATMSRGA